MPSENKEAPEVNSLRTFLQSFVDKGYFTHYYVECGFLSRQDPVLKVSFLPDDAFIFDLASLTKAIVTVPLILSIAEKYHLSLKDSIQEWYKKLDRTSQYIPQEFQKISLQSLLAHRSGLPAWCNFWINRLDSRKISEFRGDWKEHVLKVLQRVKPTQKDVGFDRYSDVGFILLAVVIEEITGQPLNSLFNEFLVKEFNLPESSETAGFWLGYPTQHQDKVRDFISTGYCKIRQRALIGEVHDENAAAFGGPSGHAGLFGSGEGLVEFIRRFLASKIGKSFLQMNQKLSYGKDHKPIGLGWRAGDDDSSRVFGDGKAIGHMGFTGTAFWIDPVHLTYGIFLTNRVISGRRSSFIKEIRREVFTQLQKALN